MIISNCFSKPVQTSSILPMTSRGIDRARLELFPLFDEFSHGFLGVIDQGSGLFLEASHDAIDTFFARRFEPSLQAVERIGRKTLSKRVELAAALFDSFNCPATIRLEPLGPGRVEGLGGLLAGFVQLPQRLVDPRAGLRGRDFGENTLCFFPESLAHFIQGGAGPLSNRGARGLKEHFFHLLMKLAD